MREAIQTAVSLLYPPRCLGCGDLVESDFGLCGPCWRDTPFIGGLVCDACGAPLPGEDTGPVQCDDCLASPRPWVQGRAALLYRGQARRLVLGLKHGDRADMARPAGVWLARAARPLLRDRMIIAPVPLHRTRLLRRRYNQSALLVQALARETVLPYCPDLLIRTQRTETQDGKSVEARQTNLDGAISVHLGRRHRLAGRPVLIVDDVMTSGATFAACTEAALAGGATQVFVLALARVTRED